jgi:hypothetical protein
MNRIALAVVACGASWAVLGEGRAWGQISPPSLYRPVVSPYINLLRNNTGVGPFNTGAVNTAVNYFGLVRPEFGFQAAVTGLQQDVLSNQQQTQLLTTGLNPTVGVPVTGHPAFFLNSRAYFLTTTQWGTVGWRGGPGASSVLGASGALLPGSRGLGTGMGAGGMPAGGMAPGASGGGGTRR